MNSKKLLIGNWKMNGSIKSLQTFFSELSIQSIDSINCEYAICTPYPYLSIAAHLIEQSGLPMSYGAQDCSAHQDAGAYTGEVSANMLADFACRWVIIGHSERRQYHQESNKLIAEKFIAVQQAGLIPVLCVGESLSDRESGNALAVVESQLIAVIDEVGIEAFGNAVVAYEPIWAIGTGKTATPEDAQQMHEHLRRSVAMRNTDIAQQLNILYGGSVKPSNAKELFSQTDINGGLVGGASLDAESFAGLIAATL